MTVAEMIEWLQKQPADYVVGLAYDGFIGEATWKDVGVTKTCVTAEGFCPYGTFNNNTIDFAVGGWDVLRADGGDKWDKTTSYQSSLFVCPAEKKLSASKETE